MACDPHMEKAQGVTQALHTTIFLGSSLPSCISTELTGFLSPHSSFRLLLSLSDLNLPSSGHYHMLISLLVTYFHLLPFSDHFHVSTTLYCFTSLPRPLSCFNITCSSLFLPTSPCNLWLVQCLHRGLCSGYVIY